MNWTITPPDDGQHNLPAMRSATVLEEKNSLPGPELQFAIDDGNRFARACQRHPNMRGHVVESFVVVFELVVLRDEAIEKSFEIAARGRRGVLHRNQTATRVRHENRHDAVAYVALVDPGLYFVRDFVSAFPFGAKFQLLVMDAHKLK